MKLKNSYFYTIRENIKDEDSVSGNLTITNLTGDKIDIDAVSGAIALANVSGEKIDIDSVSGAISLTDMEGNINLDTVSGSIDIYIGEEVGFEIVKVESVSGNFDNEFGVKKQGEAIVKYDIETTSGNITIHKK